MVKIVQNNDTNIDPSFQVKNKALPFPRCDLPWGVTQAFFDTDARLVNQPDPIITMVGNQTKEFVIRLEFVSEAGF
jgi:hypothetical protein